MFIIAVEKNNETVPMYTLCWGNVPSLKIRIPENELTTTSPETISFTLNGPHFVVVDNFYTDPIAIRKLALNQKYVEAAKFYKGKRSEERFLLPHVKERFEALLGKRIIDWLSNSQSANGKFQLTNSSHPLVWHSDSQDYAAAIYLTPNAPPGAGTSFWMDKLYKCRRPPGHAMEPKLSDEENMKRYNEVYTEFNILNPDNWILCDKIAAVFNRLVLWDGRLIHSASSYDSFSSGGGEDDDSSRLVQLFFFNVEK
jgi:hypothetical protein